MPAAHVTQAASPFAPVALQGLRRCPAPHVGFGEQVAQLVSVVGVQGTVYCPVVQLLVEQVSHEGFCVPAELQVPAAQVVQTASEEIVQAARYLPLAHVGGLLQGAQVVSVVVVQGGA